MLRPSRGSAIEKIDTLINWPPGESTNLHQQSNHRSIYLCMLRHAPPPSSPRLIYPMVWGSPANASETTLPDAIVIFVEQSVCREPIGITCDPGVWPQPDRGEPARVREIFGAILQRSPQDSEAAAAIQYVRSLESSLDAAYAESAMRRMKAWASLCQALMASNEFRYID